MSPNKLQSQLISTSALAKKLELQARTVFELLVEKGWIERVGKLWKLTGKGQFEGGDYVNSKKYGEFIGWPETVLEHPIFAELFHRPLRTRVIGKELDISAHRFNALLAELGWQQRFHRGWVLTPAGQSYGGEESEDEESGVPYTLWPRTALEEPTLAAALKSLEEPLHGLKQRLNAQRNNAPSEAPNASQEPAAQQEQDASQSQSQSQQQQSQTMQQALALQLDEDEEAAPTSAPSDWLAMDGHRLAHAEDAALDNWFYLMGITHAYRRELPEASLGCSDFYLPAAHLHIECWHANDAGAALRAKMARVDYYEKNALPYFEIAAEELLHLDAVLPKTLLKHGVTVF